MEELVKKYRKLEIKDVNIPSVVVSQEACDARQDRISLSVFGKILGVKVANRGALFSTPRTIWQTSEGFSMDAVHLNNTFAITFCTEWDKWKILSGGPWSVFNRLMVLAEPEGIGKITDQKFDTVDFWIQVHGMELWASECGGWTLNW